MEREIVGDVAGRVGMDEPQRAGATGVDLRRIRRREEVEAILNRAQQLSAPDRALLVAVFQGGQSATQVAALRGVEPRVVRREVRRLVSRVLAPEFQHVLRRRQRWPRVRQQVGQMCFIEGLSLRAVAERLSLTVYAVRRHSEWIRAGAADGDVGELAERRAIA